MIRTSDIFAMDPDLLNDILLPDKIDAILDFVQEHKLDKNTLELIVEKICQALLFSMDNVANNSGFIAKLMDVLWAAQTISNELESMELSSFKTLFELMFKVMLNQGYTIFLKQIFINMNKLLINLNENKFISDAIELNWENIEQLGRCLLEIGDYECQAVILETMIRVINEENRERVVSKWFPKNSQLQTMILTFVPSKFEVDCRRFLNIVNQKINKKVHSFLASKIFIGNYEAKEPPESQLWVDFNMDSTSLSFYCSDLSQDSQNQSWETIVLDKTCIKYLLLRMGVIQGVQILGIKLKCDCSQLINGSPKDYPHLKGSSVTIHFNEASIVHKYMIEIFGGLYKGQQVESSQPQDECSLKMDFDSSKSLSQSSKASIAMEPLSLSFGRPNQMICNKDNALSMGNSSNFVLSKSQRSKAEDGNFPSPSKNLPDSTQTLKNENQENLSFKSQKLAFSETPKSSKAWSRTASQSKRKYFNPLARKSSVLKKAIATCRNKDFSSRRSKSSLAISPISTSCYKSHFKNKSFRASKKEIIKTHNKGSLVKRIKKSIPILVLSKDSSKRSSKMGSALTKESSNISAASFNAQAITSKMDNSENLPPGDAKANFEAETMTPGEKEEDGKSSTTAQESEAKKIDVFNDIDNADFFKVPQERCEKNTNSPKISPLKINKTKISYAQKINESPLSPPPLYEQDEKTRSSYLNKTKLSSPSLFKDEGETSSENRTKGRHSMRKAALVASFKNRSFFSKFNSREIDSEESSPHKDNDLEEAPSIYDLITDERENKTKQSKKKSTAKKKPLPSEETSDVSWLKPKKSVMHSSKRKYSKRKVHQLERPPKRTIHMGSLDGSRSSDIYDSRNKKSKERPATKIKKSNSKYSFGLDDVDYAEIENYDLHIERPKGTFSNGNSIFRTEKENKYNFREKDIERNSKDNKNENYNNDDSRVNEPTISPSIDSIENLPSAKATPNKDEGASMAHQTNYNIHTNISQSLNIILNPASSNSSDKQSPRRSSSPELIARKRKSQRRKPPSIHESSLEENSCSSIPKLESPSPLPPLSLKSVFDPTLMTNLETSISDIESNPKTANKTSRLDKSGGPTKKKMLEPLSPISLESLPPQENNFSPDESFQYSTQIFPKEFRFSELPNTSHFVAASSSCTHHLNKLMEKNEKNSSYLNEDSRRKSCSKDQSSINYSRNLEDSMNLISSDYLSAIENYLKTYRHFTEKYRKEMMEIIDEINSDAMLLNSSPSDILDYLRQSKAQRIVLSSKLDKLEVVVNKFRKEESRVKENLNQVQLQAAREFMGKLEKLKKKSIEELEKTVLSQLKDSLSSSFCI